MFDVRAFITFGLFKAFYAVCWMCLPIGSFWQSMKPKLLQSFAARSILLSMCRFSVWLYSAVSGVKWWFWLH